MIFLTTTSGRKLTRILKRKFHFARIQNGNVTNVRQLSAFSPSPSRMRCRKTETKAKKLSLRKASGGERRAEAEECQSVRRSRHVAPRALHLS